jgi:hypothetical protein
MKHETKLKIVQVIKSLLRWNETQYQSPVIEIQRFNIRMVQSHQRYSHRDLMVLSFDQLKYHANLQLISQLEANGLIKYETVDNPNELTAHKTFVASLKVIIP